MRSVNYSMSGRIRGVLSKNAMCRVARSRTTSSGTEEIVERNGNRITLFHITECQRTCEVLKVSLGLDIGPPLRLAVKAFPDEKVAIWCSVNPLSQSPRDIAGCRQGPVS